MSESCLRWCSSRYDGECDCAEYRAAQTARHDPRNLSLRNVLNLPVPLDAGVPWPRPIVKGECRWCGKPAYSPRATWCGEWRAWEMFNQDKKRHGQNGFWFMPCMDAVGGWWWGAGAIRRAIFKRDGFRCLACGQDAERIDVGGVMVPSMTNLHVDHIIPVAHGGLADWNNLRTLCAPCNLSKGARLELVSG